jgi:cytidylate kinase
MVLTELPLKNKIKHVYLEDAKMLRTDLSSVYNIALDGPAGSGKSTVAKTLAKEYNILYLDTGAMYRACALKAIRENIDPRDRVSVESIVEKLNVKVEYFNGSQHTYLDGEDVSDKIRVNEVSMAASHISAHPCVRIKMVEMQREIAKQMSCILDGGDIGSAVLPDAKFKFFLTADSKIRAKRRYDELIEKGQTVDFEKLHAEIVQRDKQDSEREFSPLVCAEDAIVIDTSDLTVEEVLAKLKSYIQERI